MTRQSQLRKVLLSELHESAVAVIATAVTAASAVTVPSVATLITKQSKDQTGYKSRLKS